MNTYNIYNKCGNAGLTVPLHVTIVTVLIFDRMVGRINNKYFNRGTSEKNQFRQNFRQRLNHWQRKMS